MTDIHDIVYKDIELFLTQNNVRLSPISKKSNYNKAFEMIKQDKNYIYPDAVYDWIIAYNFIADGKEIDNYSREEIVSLTDDKLKYLAEELGVFNSNNIKASVMNVLKYLHKIIAKVETATEYAVYHLPPIVNNYFYHKDSFKNALMLLKPRQHEVVYTNAGIKILNLNPNRLPSYIRISNMVAMNKDLITIPYLKGRSVEEIQQLIEDFNNQPKYDITDLNYLDYGIYQGKYGNILLLEDSLKATLSCQKYQYIMLGMAPKGTEWYNKNAELLAEAEKMKFNLFGAGRMIMGKNNNYVITSGTVGFKDVLKDLEKCQKVYYLIGTQKNVGKIGEYADTAHAMAIVIDPNEKLLEIFDSNGLTPDSKHVYFWCTKLAEYLTEHGFEVYRKINADEPYCPQSVTQYAKEFNKEGQCTIWAYWYIWLRMNNPDIPGKVIRRYLAEMSPDEAFDRVRRLASKFITADERIEAVYSITGPRKILMLRKLISKEVIYTPYGVQYLKLNQNKLPTYYESFYLTDVEHADKFVSIPYQKGRTEEEINCLIKEKLS